MPTLFIANRNAVYRLIKYYIVVRRVIQARMNNPFKKTDFHPSLLLAAAPLNINDDH
jgi:hypothetical protein